MEYPFCYDLDDCNFTCCCHALGGGWGGVVQTKPARGRDYDAKHAVPGRGEALVAPRWEPASIRTDSLTVGILRRIEPSGHMLKPYTQWKVNFDAYDRALAARRRGTPSINLLRQLFQIVTGSPFRRIHATSE